MSRYHSIFNEIYKDIFEKCHLKFIRYILGVHKYAPKIGIYGETGRYPICINAVQQFVKFWFRVENFSEESNSLMYNAVLHNNVSQGSWYYSIQKLCNLVNLTVEQAKHKNIQFLSKNISEVFRKEFIKGWYENLHSDKRTQGNTRNKLRVYRTFKNEFMRETYLDTCSNTVFRNNICKFRISCHKLHIETGRYVKNKQLKPEERICDHCDINEVEDECHFLLRCPLYERERNDLFVKLNTIYKGFNELSNEIKFNVIMSSQNKEILMALGYFITICFRKRLTIA